jgi:hypothetical protein
MVQWRSTAHPACRNDTSTDIGRGGVGQGVHTQSLMRHVVRYEFLDAVGALRTLQDSW